MKAFDLPILERFINATLTAELKPITKEYVQSDEGWSLYPRIYMPVANSALLPLARIHLRPDILGLLVIAGSDNCDRRSRDVIKLIAVVYHGRMKLKLGALYTRWCCASAILGYYKANCDW